MANPTIAIVGRPNVGKSSFLTDLLSPVSVFRLSKILQELLAIVFMLKVNG